MGYTTAPYSVFASDMQQTPENVAKVLDIAGWKVEEAGDAIGVHPARIYAAANGDLKLKQGDWQKLLDVSGRRAFDWEE